MEGPAGGLCILSVEAWQAATFVLQQSDLSAQACLRTALAALRFFLMLDMIMPAATLSTCILSGVSPRLQDLFTNELKNRIGP